MLCCCTAARAAVCRCRVLLHGDEDRREGRLHGMAEELGHFLLRRGDVPDRLQTEGLASPH